MRLAQVWLLVLVVTNVQIGFSGAQSLTEGADSIWSQVPAKRWQEAFVAGNGRQGVMVYGDPLNERIIFNHEKLYEPRRGKTVKAPDVGHTLPEIRRLHLAGEFKQAADYFWDECVKAGHSQILWTEPYHPAFALTIKTPSEGGVSDYRRVCDLPTGQVWVQWSDDSGAYRRRSFVSRSADVVVQEIVGLAGQPVSCVLHLESQGIKPFKPLDPNEVDPKVIAKHAKNLDGVLDPSIQIDDQWLVYRLGYKQTSGGYEGVTRVVVEGGSKQVSDEGLSIRDAKRVLMLTKVTPLGRFADSQVEVTQQTLAELPADYDQLLLSHAEEHGEIYNRVSVDLGGTDSDHALSTEALLAMQKALPEGVCNKALLEKVFKMGVYTLISSSGDYPPNLQAIWNGEFQPAWSGDFTLDANLNLQIAGANLLGLREVTQSYASLMTKIRPDWEDNAQRILGCRGLMSGARTSGVDGHNYHISKNFPSNAWTAGTQWLTFPMIEAYETTGDRAFLEQTVMPFVVGIAQFYEDFLKVTGPDGKLVFSPSYSPEHRSPGFPTMIMNATMDVAAGKEALKYAISLSNELGVNQDKIAVWEALLEKMPEYRINGDGALAEWIPANMGDRYDHRHVSHLYPLWPGHEINPEQTPELFEAAVVAAHKRGRGNGSAHGLSHMALIATRLKQADLVAGNLAFLMTNDYLLPSLFTQHNPNWLFNADALHSIPAVIAEMLAYSRRGEIELLPAVSDEFGRGTVSGLQTRTQVAIERLEWDLPAGQISVRLVPRKTQAVTLRLRRGIKSVSDGRAALDLSSPTTVELALKQGVPLELKISF